MSEQLGHALEIAGVDPLRVGMEQVLDLSCRVCHTGKCPMGIATQDSELRSRLDIERSSTGLANYLRVCTSELSHFARLTGHDNVHGLSIADLCTTNSEISQHTAVAHV